MRILASYNLKGGVGKTAAAVNLAYCAAREGRRVLVWDLDPQGAASFYLRTTARVKGGVERLLTRSKELRNTIRETDYEHIDVVPADFSYRHMDADLREAGEPRKRLMRLIEPLAEDYDLVLLDCPPTLSLVSENIFHAADHLLVPLIPTPLSLRAYEQLQAFHLEQGYLCELIPFFSMVDRRRQLHLQVIAEFLPRHPEVLRTFVPYNSTIERMGAHQGPVGSYAAGDVAGRCFEALWQAVKERMGADAE